MSAYVVEDVTINTIVNGLAGLSVTEPWITDPLKPYGFTPGSQPSEATRQDLGRALFALNCLGVNERYGQGEAKEFRSLDYTYGAILPPSPVQLYKAIGCLRYQCSEGEAVNHPLYAVLTELYNNVAHYIVTRTTEYEKAQWG
jgi:hypothetical protein